MFHKAAQTVLASILDLVVSSTQVCFLQNLRRWLSVELIETAVSCKQTRWLCLRTTVEGIMFHTEQCVTTRRRVTETSQTGKTDFQLKENKIRTSHTGMLQHSFQLWAIIYFFCPVITHLGLLQGIIMYHNSPPPDYVLISTLQHWSVFVWMDHVSAALALSSTCLKGAKNNLQSCKMSSTSSPHHLWV